MNVGESMMGIGLQDTYQGYVFPRLCVPLRVVLPLKGLKKRITLASQKC